MKGIIKHISVPTTILGLYLNKTWAKFSANPICQRPIGLFKLFSIRRQFFDGLYKKDLNLYICP